MLLEDYCSLISSVIFIIVYIPQLYRVIKLGESKSLSLYYLILLLTSYCFFIIFAYKKELIFQFIGTIIQLTFLLVLIFFKIKHTYYYKVKKPIYIINNIPNNSDQEPLSS
jgi:uncharacterized protein with PQ loop repeat